MTVGQRKAVVQLLVDLGKHSLDRATSRALLQHVTVSSASFDWQTALPLQWAAIQLCKADKQPAHFDLDGLDSHIELPNVTGLGQCEFNLLVFTENLLENTDGVLRPPHQCSLGAAPCHFLFMLTRALLMTSSQSKATATRSTPGYGSNRSGRRCRQRGRRCRRGEGSGAGLAALWSTPRWRQTQSTSHRTPKAVRWNAVLYMS